MCGRRWSGPKVGLNPLAGPNGEGREAKPFLRRFAFVNVAIAELRPAVGLFEVCETLGSLASGFGQLALAVV